MDRTALYRTIWRWHFYAGLFVIPFILLLSVTGSIYLFKPDIDAWEESAWRGPPLAQGEAAVSPDAQVRAALAAVPDSSIRSYRLPRDPGEPAVVAVGTADGAVREVFVTAGGSVSAVVDPEQRWSTWISRLHGSLLAGTIGGLIVETAASWAIVMILTGLYLWWPRGRGLAGVMWPRLGSGRRLLWRDLHAVTGFWVSGLALVLLVSGLPWTDGWATGFRIVRAEMGWTSAMPQEWKGGAASERHDHHGGVAVDEQGTMPATPTGGVTYATIVALAGREAMPFPVLIQPPHAPSRFGPPNGVHWKLTSEAQNRPLIRTVLYDAGTAAVVERKGFADKHAIDRAINYGIAWHEGQLFGRINQAIGVATALALLTLAVSGTVMWWRRRPEGGLGAPPAPPAGKGRGVLLLLLIPALLLPMLALSLLLVGLIEAGVRLVRRRATA